MQNIKKLFIVFFLFFLICQPLFADEQEIADKYKDYKVAEVEASSKNIYNLEENFKYHFYAGASEGYDNNVFLDPSRKGDVFDQAMADIIARYRLTDQIDLKAHYDFTSITYHEFTKLSLIENDVSASLEYYPHKRVKIEMGYDIDFIDYFKNKSGDFTTNGPFAGIKYYIDKNTYVGAMYQCYFYDYKHRDIRNSSNNKIDTTREDNRNNVAGEVVTHLGKVFVKLKNTYYFNDSNDEYMDYYDYQSNRVNLYTAYPLTEKLSVLLSGGYQYKDFKSRTITTDSGKKEHDNLMTLGTGINYKLFSAFYISANYTYRQNYSNDPLQDYSGSVSTVGINYFF